MFIHTKESYKYQTCKLESAVDTSLSTSLSGSGIFDRALMYSMWNNYNKLSANFDKLSVKILSYLMEVAMDTQKARVLVLRAPSQRAFKNSLTCLECSFFFISSQTTLDVSLWAWPLYTCSTYLKVKLSKFDQYFGWKLVNFIYQTPKNCEFNLSTRAWVVSSKTGPLSLVGCLLPILVHLNPLSKWHFNWELELCKGFKHFVDANLDGSHVGWLWQALHQFCQALSQDPKAISGGSFRNVKSSISNFAGPSQWTFKHSLTRHECSFGLSWMLLFLVSFLPTYLTLNMTTLYLLKLLRSLKIGQQAMDKSLLTPSIELPKIASLSSQLKLECKLGLNDDLCKQLPGDTTSILLIKGAYEIETRNWKQVLHPCSSFSFSHVVAWSSQAAQSFSDAIIKHFPVMSSPGILTCLVKWAPRHHIRARAPLHNDNHHTGNG